MKILLFCALMAMTSAGCSLAPSGGAAGATANGQAQGADPAAWTGGRERARAYNTSNGG